MWKYIDQARPWAFGDFWDKMDVPTRRMVFVGDLVLGLGGTALIYWIFL